jgi:hypothetical protein
MGKATTTTGMPSTDGGESGWHVELVTVPKHVRRLEGLGANVLSLYAKGLTTGEIQAHLAEIYGR